MYMHTNIALQYLVKVCNIEWEKLRTIQGRRKRDGRGGLSRPTFLGNLNYELVHSVSSQRLKTSELIVYVNAADHDECCVNWLRLCALLMHRDARIACF